jgi:hypothetical protein
VRERFLLFKASEKNSFTADLSSEKLHKLISKFLQQNSFKTTPKIAPRFLYNINCCTDCLEIYALFPELVARNL